MQLGRYSSILRAGPQRAGYHIKENMTVRGIIASKNQRPLSIHMWTFQTRAQTIAKCDLETMHVHSFLQIAVGA
jgi:hypothetical protein